MRTAERGRAPGGLHAWVLASRPKTLFAAAAPVIMGGGLALGDDRFRALPFAAAMLGALLIQIGTNLANDYSDFMRGVDTPERKGFTRVAQSGLIPPARLRVGIVVTFGVAALIGLYLIRVGGWPILVIGLASIAAGVAYTGGPWPFGYRGLGDLFVFVFFGLVAVGGTYYVQALALPAAVLWAGAAIGALTTAILVVNNLRDRKTDARAGKRTLAVLLGERVTRLEYTLLLAAAAAVPPLGVLALGWPATACVSLAAFALAPRPLRTVWSYGDPAELNATLAETSRLAGAYGLLFAAGVAV